MNYTLHYKGASALAQSLGAELASYQDAAGTNYVWSGDPAYWSSHAPVLFPIVGALKQDTITFGGTAYTMPKHGIVRKRQWQCIAQTENSITFEITADDDTRAMYPFDFSLQVTHTLHDQGFTTKYTVRNTGKQPMGTCLGGHAGFCCPLHEGEHFEDYDLLFEKDEACQPLYTDSASILHKDQRLEVPWDGRTMPLRYSLFEKDVLVFDGLNSRRVTVKNRNTGHGFTFDFNGFSHLGVWTPPAKNAPFLCLEPWKGLPAWDDETGAFEDKPDTVWMEPCGTMSAEYTMRIL